MSVGRLLAILLLAGCAEITRAPPPEPPSALAGALLADPLPAILDNAARDFAGGGAGLEGRPQATALALARVEWIGGETRPGFRLAALPESFTFALQRSVEEGRASLGIAAEATPEASVAALVAAAQALARQDEAAALRALVPPTITATGRPVMSRLRDPGAFPNAALTLPAVRDEVARQRAVERADGSLMVNNPGTGIGTLGIEGSVGLR